jgi:tRNA-dihydrouridine synthase A
MAINGGIKSLEEAKAHLEHMDGVMVGREAYQNPGILASVDREILASKARMPIRLPWCGRCIRILSAS